MNDAAQFLQQQYDEAVHQFGPDSEEAKQAEREALAFFQRLPATAKSGIFSNQLEYLA